MIRRVAGCVVGVLGEWVNEGVYRTATGATVTTTAAPGRARNRRNRRKRITHGGLEAAQAVAAHAAPAASPAHLVGQRVLLLGRGRRAVRGGVREVVARLVRREGVILLLRAV